MVAGTVAQLEAAITQAFGLRSSYGTPCNPCAAGDAIGVLVRLAFHDAAGGGGRADGCVDFTSPENNGLQSTVSTLRALWQPLSGRGVSLADTFILAGALAIRHASTPAQNNRQLPAVAGPLVLPTRVGRADAPTCSDAGELPVGASGWPELVASFGAKWGHTAVDVVAIMGAHTVGRAEAANSGIDGGWTGFQVCAECCRASSPCFLLAIL